MSRATNQLPETVKKDKEYQYPVNEKGQRIITKMTPKAWDILFLYVTNPNMTQEEIANSLDSHQVYVSRVMCSPCFQKELTEIRRQRIHDKLNLTMLDGVDRMQRIFNDEESADANAVAAFKAVASAAGMGAGNGGGGGNHVSVNVNAESLGVTSDMIAEANERRRKNLFEGDFTEVTDE